MTLHRENELPRVGVEPDQWSPPYKNNQVQIVDIEPENLTTLQQVAAV